ncbi:MAG: glycolate oxidase subunit GlcE [Pseudomonadota bacterium]
MVLAPASTDELIGIVAESRAGATPLEIVGSQAKPDLGRVMQTAQTVSLRAVTGITLYEPSEMVIGARAGTPLDEVIAALDQKGQMLPFEPRNFGALYGTGSAGTIGSVAATNLSGPRRVSVGAARDHLIGVTAVTGRAEEVSTGGRVMKNVTGYDLVKLFAGSHGTLGVFTEVIFKVLPKPETEATLVYEGLDAARAVELLCRAMGTPYEVSGAAHLPAVDGTTSRTVVRLEGFAMSVDYRCGEVDAELRDYGRPQRLGAGDSADLWRQVRDLDVLAVADDEAVWQISTAPRRGPDVAQALHAATDARLIFDWSGGLVVAATPATDEAAGAVRSSLAPAGGHATLLRGPASLRGHVDVFQPLLEPVMDLTRRIKAEFDPDGVLNPGKMYQGV